MGQARAVLGPDSGAVGWAPTARQPDAGCHRLNGDPQGDTSAPPIPGSVSLFRNGVFAEVIKLQVSNWAPSPVTGVLRRERRGGFETWGHTEGKAVWGWKQRPG